MIQSIEELEERQIALGEQVLRIAKQLLQLVDNMIHMSKRIKRLEDEMEAVKKQ